MVDTDGWYAVIGDLGRKQPRLEIWLDRFSNHPKRRFYAGFYSGDRRRVTAITERVSRKLWPIRIITHADLERKKLLALKKPLPRDEFNAPILEKYLGSTYFGIYDPTLTYSRSVNPFFRARAVAFFEDVARSLHYAATADEQREVYPQWENRKRVVSHLARERSGLLAAERKIRDNYRCQVCEMRFDEVYGSELGSEFAEAHHLVPLSQLRGHVKTRLEDLGTVCANCHRMLHRLSGNRDDITRLKAIVCKRRIVSPPTR